MKRTKTIQTKGVTFCSLFKLNCVCFSGFLAIIFLLVIVVNIFMPSSISPTANGFEVSGIPAVGMAIVLYPVFVLGFSLNLSIFMFIGQKIFTKFRSYKIEIICE